MNVHLDIDLYKVDTDPFFFGRNMILTDRKDDENTITMKKKIKFTCGEGVSVH